MNAQTKIDVYQIITDRIIELLEKGIVPWQQPWKNGQLPMNLVSKRPYKGINVWLLSSMNYEYNAWLTFEQLKKLGGSVLRGEHGTIICFWKTVKKDEDVEEEEQQSKKSHSVLKYYKVFNVAQCGGISEDMLPKIEAYDHDPMLECEAIVAGMPKSPAIRVKNQKAFYHPAEDYINMPKKKSFITPETYYSTLFHELIHATGHASRLGRKSITELHEFGDEEYSKEELVAEIGGCYLSNFAGILEKNIGASTSYIDGWLKQLKNDKRFIVFAAAQAQRAADYILNIQPQEKEETAVV